MHRIYESVIAQHLQDYRQMAFICGPRQAGKTTLAMLCAHDYPHLYLNWDNLPHRELILSGIENIMAQLDTPVLQHTETTPVVILDELHKCTDWKNLLKGYFDTLDNQCKIIVTGSAKLNVFRHGGDSLMGRYFLYRIHPLTVAEINGRGDYSQIVVPPTKLSEENWLRLQKYGGFPEPYLQADDTFYERWCTLKQSQLFKEELRELSRVHEIAKMELLSHVLINSISGRTIYTDLAKVVRVSEPTIRDWIEQLQNLYYCFSIKPWHKNITRSLVKDPKTYLWDWSTIQDKGAKLENIVACHLRKATHYWTDVGLGQFDLYYLRDKDKREVDFLVTNNNEPWMLVEVKSSSNGRLSPHLLHFNEQVHAPHVFEVVGDMPYIERDCFALKKPMIVPALTFLSQLV